MISFPNAKINLGLHVIEQLVDGYHTIDTVFYPVGWCDALEIVKMEEQVTPTFSMEVRDADFTGDPNSNLCYKAYQLLSNQFSLPPMKCFLQKGIPSGAGLGGGSSDAAATLDLINKLQGLQLSPEQLMEYAAFLGSDCSFFINNKPVRAGGTGTVFFPVDLSLKNYYIVIVMPPFTMSTSEAYRSVKSAKPDIPLESLIMLPVSHWKHVLTNDFEELVFNKYPLLKEIKEKLYLSNAIYASMSGSGTAMYGIFQKETDLSNIFSDCKVWSGKALH